MSKIKIVYWSGTGNTESMANFVRDGVSSAGKEAELIEVSDADAESLKEEAVFALGCPACGSEELEESEMEPFVSQLEEMVSGKKIGLFGSYGWGGGEYMKTWQERLEEAGASIVGGEGVVCENEPDDEAEENCKKLGEELAAFL